MIPARLVIDFRGASEFAPHDQCDILVQSPLCQVLNQRRNAGVESRQMSPTVPEVIAVRIPEPIGHCDNSNPGLDQPSRDQQLVIPERRAIAEVFG